MPAPSPGTLGDALLTVLMAKVLHAFVVALAAADLVVSVTLVDCSLQPHV